ncbi:hypothetical protein CVT26_011616 [Gymnopilus dilepis]|uniref:Uncharacterized protein n=1 Tax=Gymnopilus dilepis TaxID=231916 RepID=A0A409YQK9_9AGAR|nr:hypothetical protein CVT26_011616 [Gymnopilus dilepis]
MQSIGPNPSVTSSRSRPIDVEMGDNIGRDPDEAHVEHLLRVPDHTMLSIQAPSTPLPTPVTKALPHLPTAATPPTLALNNIPFTFPAPSQNAHLEKFPQTAGFAKGSSTRQTSKSRSRSRSPSPGGREGEQMATCSETARSKIRLVGIADPQKEALISALTEQISKSNNFLQIVGRQLEEIKRDTAALCIQAQEAENRSKQAEMAIQSQQTLSDVRLKDLEKSLKEDASQKVQLAEKRTQSMLLDIQGLRRIGSTPNTGMSEEVPMIIDRIPGKHSAPSPNPRPPVPPRFPQPALPPVHPHAKVDSTMCSKCYYQETDIFAEKCLSKPLPSMPLYFERPRSNGETTLPCSQSSESESSEDELGRSRPNLATPHPEELINLLFTTLGINARRGSRRRKGHPEFKDPAKKRAKEEGTTALTNWLRHHLHHLIGIKKTRDILKLPDEIYASNTELQRTMALWETDKTGQGPTVDPMKINWDNFEGPWNMQLCEAFVQYCIEKGLGEGNPPEDVKEFVADYFWGRLQRLRTTIRKNKPGADEDPETHNARVEGRHLESLVIARRNTRRNQLFKDRVDICFDNLPKTASEIVTDEQRLWKARYDIVQALGPEGMSSDESDLDSDKKTFIVKKIPWRNRRLTEVVQGIDKSRNLTNAYGNTRPGNSPRTRIRRDRPRKSARKKAPTGKPVDMYDTDWYEKLTYRKQIALKAERAMKY